jgi:mono/diheme cytochrome c family protein
MNSGAKIMRFNQAIFLVLPILVQPAAAESWDKVNPVFQERCVMCHSGEGAPLGLRLDSHENALKGSENGPVIFPGDPDKSPLMHRLTGKAEPRMPMTGPPYLDDAVIAMIGAWIKAGGKGAESAGQTAEPAPAPPAPPADPRADGRVTYSEVAPIFGKHCVECHSVSSKLGAPPKGLKLSSLNEVLAGGDDVVVLPGQAQASEIIRRVEGLSMPRMPMDGPPWLSAEEVSLLRDWIDGGAMDDEGRAAPIPAGKRVRIRGVLSAANEIDGARFHLTAGTDLDHPPAVGGRAELRGHLASDGKIIAERLRSR